MMSDQTHHEIENTDRMVALFFPTCAGLGWSEEYTRSIVGDSSRTLILHEPVLLSEIVTFLSSNPTILVSAKVMAG